MSSDETSVIAFGRNCNIQVMDNAKKDIYTGDIDNLQRLISKVLLVHIWLKNHIQGHCPKPK